MPGTNAVDNPLTTGAQPVEVNANKLCAKTAIRHIAKIVRPRPQGQVQIDRTPKSLAST